MTAAAGRARRGAGRSRLLVAALGLACLAVVGFGLGLIAGAFWEEPRLVASFLVGDTEKVAWGPERPLPPVGAAAEGVAEGVAEGAAPGGGASAPVAGPPPAAPRFAVQVGAFADSAAAERLAESLRGNGFAVYVAPSAGSGASRWRVRVGPLASREEAERAAERLKREETLPTWVLDEEQQ